MTRPWRNWAGIERSHPRTEETPGSIAEVQLAVQRAGAAGHTVKAIGASHSFSGIGATDGVRISMSHLRGLISADLARTRVTLWAGTHLWELPAILEPLGMALPNLGDIDRQTISGAIQTGTHGTGLGQGGLATGVVGMELVTARGELLTISEDSHPELLPAVALGLGALGIVVSVTLQCVSRFTLHAEERPMPLDEVLDRYEELNTAADHFEFFWFPHTRLARTKTNTRLPLDADPLPLSPLARFLDEEVANNLGFGACAVLGSLVPATTPTVNRFVAGLSSHRRYRGESSRVFVTQRRVKFRELEYAVPLAAVPDAMRELRALIERRRYRVSFPIEVRAAAADDLLLSTAHRRNSGYIAVHRFLGDREDRYLAEAEEILSAHDGRPHWGKIHTRTAEQLSAVHPGFSAFLGVRDRLDPDRVFTNPYIARVLGD